jgi:aldehyde:ferredoxin oxidoreductase
MTMSQTAGYTGKILRVNLSSGEISTTSSEVYTDRFLGGRGMALKIHWDEVPEHVSAFDPENRLVITPVLYAVCPAFPAPGGR